MRKSGFERNMLMVRRGVTDFGILFHIFLEGQKSRLCYLFYSKE